MSAVIAVTWTLFLMNYPPKPDERIVYQTQKECEAAAELVKKRYFDWHSPLPFCIPSEGHP